VPIWFKYHEGEFLFGTQDVAYGTAILEYDDVIAKRRLVFEQYMPAADAAALAEQLAGRWKPEIVRVKPERMITYDYAQGFGISEEGEGTKIV
jgi:hypothetical protein